MGDKTFNLRWNNHLANLSGLFEGLYRSGSLTDATLACQGGMLRAHRLVLAACSPYFERVFKEHYGEQPILILKGVAVEEMECLLDFMYRGSIDVAEDHLASLIKTATDLEIRGLSAEHKNDAVYRPQQAKPPSAVASHGRQPRCEIETRVQPIERRIKGRNVAESFRLEREEEEEEEAEAEAEAEAEEEDVKLEEIEDDPMVVDTEESFDALLADGADDQIRRVPPPMYKRETRYKGQKRVPVGRASRGTGDVLDIKIKDCVSLRDLPGDDLFEESISLSAIKEEPAFVSCSDPTVPTVQLNEDVFGRDRDADEPGVSTSGGTTTEATPTSAGKPSRSGSAKGESASKRPTTAKDHKAQYKPFSCDLCTLAFTRASHLARHRRVHTGERPFACTLCPRMFARQDKLKQHLDSHLQWPKRRSLGHSLTGHSVAGSVGAPGHTTKGKRGRPRKITSERSAMDEILKFGEFSSMLNKSQDIVGMVVGATDVVTRVKDEASVYQDVDCSYGCQVENGHDVR